MSLQLKKMAEPEGFQAWRKKFELEHGDLLGLEDIWIRETGGRNEPGAISFEDLRYFICRACYDAKHFKGIGQEHREKEKEAYEAINSKGINPVVAIEKLGKFFKDYPEAEKIIAEYWFPEAYGVHPTLPARLSKKSPKEMLRQNLTRLKNSVKLYADNAKNSSYHSTQQGPLLIPRTEGQQRIKGIKHPATDGLIFELNLLIHCYLQRTPITADLMEPHSGTRLAEKDSIIAGLVNATLGIELLAEFVHGRIDYLKKSDAKWVDWECYYEPQKVKPATTKPGQESPYIPPGLFEK